MQRFIAISLIIIAAAASRLFPHPENVTPIAAIALFAGAQYDRKWLAFAVPLATMLLSDVMLGFHSTQWAVYLGFALVVCIGFLMQHRATPLRIAAATLAGSTVFFIVSNFGVWLSGGLYPLTANGLAACFIAAVPFFVNSLLGDAFYAGLLFGGFTITFNKNLGSKTPHPTPLP